MIRLRHLGLGLLAASLCGAAVAGETVTYSYDALGRVTQVDHAGTVNDGVESGYAYDDADNRTQMTVTGAPAALAALSAPGSGPTPTEPAPSEPGPLAAPTADDP